jgi:hypothetical protein
MVALCSLVQAIAGQPANLDQLNVNEYHIELKLKSYWKVRNLSALRLYACLCCEAGRTGKTSASWTPFSRISAGQQDSSCMHALTRSTMNDGFEDSTQDILYSTNDCQQAFTKRTQSALAKSIEHRSSSCTRHAWRCERQPLCMLFPSRMARGEHSASPRTDMTQT